MCVVSRLVIYKRDGEEGFRWKAVFFFFEASMTREFRGFDLTFWLWGDCLFLTVFFSTGVIKSILN